MRVGVCCQHWWSAQSSTFEPDKKELQRRFKAGFTTGRKNKLRRFAFMAGKMRVTVWAGANGTARRWRRRRQTGER